MPTGMLFTFVWPKPTVEYKSNNGYVEGTGGGMKNRWREKL